MEKGVNCILVGLPTIPVGLPMKCSVFKSVILELNSYLRYMKAKLLLCVQSYLLVIRLDSK